MVVRFMSHEDSLASRRDGQTPSAKAQSASSVAQLSYPLRQRRTMSFSARLVFAT